MGETYGYHCLIYGYRTFGRRSANKGVTDRSEERSRPRVRYPREIECAARRQAWNIVLAESSLPASMTVWRLFSADPERREAPGD